MAVPAPSKTAQTASDGSRRKRSNALLEAVRQIPAQVLLALGGLLMLFPVVWMLSAALKPEWQIFVRPIVWLPQHWHKVEAGSSARLLNLYTVPSSAGPRVDVIELGSRVFTTVVDADLRAKLRRVDGGTLGPPRLARVGNVELTVRDAGGGPVVAVGRDGADVLVASLEDVRDAFTAPLEAVNAAGTASVEADGASLQAVRLETARGSRLVLNLGPQTERALVADRRVASAAVLMDAGLLGSSEVRALPNDPGGVALEQFAVRGLEGGHVLLERALWRPALDLAALRQHARSMNAASLTLDASNTSFGGPRFETATLPTGERVAIVLRDGERALTVPLEVARQAVLIPAASLQRPSLEAVNGFGVRVKDFTLPTVRDETISFSRLPGAVGILGEPQETALLIPADAIPAVLDVPRQDVQKRTSLEPKWKNFADAMSRGFAGATFLTFFRNSLVITILSIIGHLISCTVVAYAFARFRAPGKNALFVIVLATMMLPEFVTLVPVYSIFRDLGMVDSLTPMYIRSFFGNAFLIFLLRQFFSTIPRDLEEAAWLDGATRFQIFTRVMLPLVTPALTTVTIFTFLWRWNDILNAAIYLNSPENFTVSMGLRAFMGQYEAEFNLLMAATTVASLPTVLLFFFAQRFFIEGITLTGSKG